LKQTTRVENDQTKRIAASSPVGDGCLKNRGQLFLPLNIADIDKILNMGMCPSRETDWCAVTGQQPSKASAIGSHFSRLPRTRRNVYGNINAPVPS
jgi:hypothetical protein